MGGQTRVVQAVVGDRVEIHWVDPKTGQRVKEEVRTEPPVSPVFRVTNDKKQEGV